MTSQSAADTPAEVSSLAGVTVGGVDGWRAIGKFPQSRGRPGVSVCGLGSLAKGGVWGAVRLVGGGRGSGVGSGGSPSAASWQWLMANWLGVSRCRLVKVDGLELHVEELDAVGTSVLDIKPWFVEFGPQARPGTLHGPRC